MVEGFIDSNTVADRVYDGLLRRAAVLITGKSDVLFQPDAMSLVPIVKFTDIPQVVQDCDDEHNMYKELLGGEREPVPPEDVVINSMIYDDYDGVKHARAYFEYRDGFVIPLKQHSWFVSRSVSAGQYPSRSFYGDISAVPVLSSLYDTVLQLAAPHGRNSLIGIGGNQDWRESKFEMYEGSRFYHMSPKIESLLELAGDSSMSDDTKRKNPRFHPSVADMLAELFTKTIERTPVPSVAEMESSK